MKRKGRFLVPLLTALLLLSACARHSADPGLPDADVGEEEPIQARQPASGEEAPPEEEPEEQEKAEEAIFPRSFCFASGAGAWSTELEVAADGSFSGLYHDTDAGDAEESYPNGTVYICTFRGQFSQPEQVDGNTYRVRLEGLEAEETEGEETFADGRRYVGSRPYGLDDADEILIYLPGSRRQDLPQAFVDWTWAFDPWDTDDELTAYGLYNVAGEQGFVAVGS